MKTIGIIGPASTLCTPEIYAFAVETGKTIGNLGLNLVCGGKDGVMEAACVGIAETTAQSIAIIPEDDKAFANAYAKIVIPTGIGTARNKIIINTADLLIAIAGGAGTLSEIAFAWQQGKTVLCVTNFGGMAAEMAGKQIDNRYANLLISVNTIDDIKKYLENKIT